MTLDQLRSFRAIIESGSFRAAALRMHRTQPAITHQIKALERETGQVLIERKYGAPTPAGHLLYTRACALLSDADALAAALRDFDETSARELRLGTSDTTALYVLPAIIRKFTRAEPQSRLHIVNRPTEHIAQMVLRGELDLGIVTLPAGAAQLEERRWFDQQLVLVVPKKHALAKRHNVRIENLRGQPLLLLEETTRTGKLLRDYFAAKRFTPTIVLATGSFEVIKRYIVEGVGISILPRETILPRDTGLVTVHVPGLPRVAIGAIWRAGAYRTRAVSAFLAQLYAAAK